MIDEKILLDELTKCKDLGRKSFESVLKVINNQPKVGEWIPCSEQEEPTEDGMYLVSGRWLRSGEKVVDSCEFFGEWKCVNNFIIEAWMKLPPAYKGE